MTSGKYTVPIHGKPYGLRFYTFAHKYNLDYIWHSDTKFYNTVFDMWRAKKMYESNNNEIYSNFYRAIPFHVYYDEFVNWSKIYNKPLYYNDNFRNPLLERIEKGFTTEQKYLIYENLIKNLRIDFYKRHMPENLYKQVFCRITESMEYDMLGIKLDKSLIPNDRKTPIMGLKSEDFKDVVTDYLGKVKAHIRGEKIESFLND